GCHWAGAILWTVLTVHVFELWIHYRIPASVYSLSLEQGISLAQLAKNQRCPVDCGHDLHAHRQPADLYCHARPGCVVLPILPLQPPARVLGQVRVDYCLGLRLGCSLCHLWCPSPGSLQGHVSGLGSQPRQRTVRLLLLRAASQAGI
ncbi:hypothetical protein HDU91_003478, partial [Kappamyces sp. JEL0680]